MADFEWLRTLRPEQTAFEAFEEECFQYFEQENDAFQILNKILSSEEVSLKNDEEGNVVVVIRDGVKSKDNVEFFHLHYFRLLEVLKLVLMEFKQFAQKDGRRDSGRMLDRFRFSFTNALYSVKDLKQERADINKKIKGRLGDKYDLDGNGDFPKVELKPYQILGLRKIMSERKEDSNKVASFKTFFSDFAKSMFTIDDATSKTCHFVELHLKSQDHLTKHLTTEQEKAGALGLSDATFFAVYSLAEKRSIVAQETLSIRNDLNMNHVEEACEDAKMDFVLEFGHELPLIYNVALIKIEEDEGRPVPEELKVGQSSMKNCVKILYSVGGRVKEDGKLLGSFKTIKKYLCETTGIVAIYETKGKRGGKSNKSLLMVSWIDKSRLMDQILMNPITIVERFREFEKDCEDFVGGIQMSNIGNSSQIHDQVLERLQNELCKMRDTATVVHHVIKHGDFDLPIQMATGENVRDVAKEYLRKVQFTATRCVAAEITGKFSQWGEYSLTITKKCEEENCFRIMSFFISQEGLLTLKTAY